MKLNPAVQSAGWAHLAHNTPRPQARTADEIHHDLARIQSHPRNPRVVNACGAAIHNYKVKLQEQAKEPVGGWKQDQTVGEALDEVLPVKTSPLIEAYSPAQAKWLITQLEKHSTDQYGDPRL